MTEVSFGEWLKRQRKGRGLTQKEMAHQIGCAVITLRKIEAEERRPSAQIVERLAEILDIPQDERTAFQRFARGDWRAMPTQIGEEYPWRTSNKSPRTNLPASTTSLIGREKEIADVREYLLNADIRLVTLIGPPGIGKTRLSIEAARESLNAFPEGVFFVALASLEDPPLIALTIAQTLGYVEAKNLTASQQLVNGIGEKRILLVLDNCEHLIEAVASLASELLSSCPRLKILATSRESLRVSGEWLYLVPTLSVPKEDTSIDIQTVSKFPALTLFAERARAVKSGFTLKGENIQAIATICTQLDGLPLAIELLAARIRWMSPEALLSRLSGQFLLHADGMRVVSDRHKTLRKAIAWSYDLLTAKEQTLFRRLAVFVGGWTLDAAQAICSDDVLKANEIPGLLLQLVDKSLVIMQEQERKARYQTLETIRQYAQEKLVESREEGRVRNQHLEFFMQLAEEAEIKLSGAEQTIWLKQLEIEQGNLRAALNWGLGNKAEAGFRLASALWLFWFMRAHFIEGKQWYDKALLLSTDASSSVQIRLFTGAASNAMGRGDIDQTEMLSNQGLTLALEQEDERGIAMSLHHLGAAAIWQSNYKRAQKLLEEGLDLSHETGNWAITGYLLGDLGGLALLQGEFEHARSILDENLILGRKHHDLWQSSNVLASLANLMLKQGDYDQARLLCEKAIALAYELGGKREISYQLLTMGIVAFNQVKLERAARLLIAAKALAEDIGIEFEPDERASYDHAVATVNLKLGKDAFEMLATESHAMTMEQAVAYALEKQGD